jgi:hypothetical protein
VAVKAAHFARPPGLGLDGGEHGDNITVRRRSEYSIRTLQNADEKHRRINGLLQSLHLVFDSKNVNVVYDEITADDAGVQYDGSASDPRIGLNRDPIMTRRENDA